MPERLRPAISNRVMALARVAGAVRVRRLTGAEFLVGRDLAEQFRQRRRIADIAAGDLDCPDFQRVLVDPQVDLAPKAAPQTAMLAGVPLALGLDAGAVRCPAGYCAAMPERGSDGAAAPVSRDTECSRPTSSDGGTAR